MLKKLDTLIREKQRERKANTYRPLLPDGTDVRDLEPVEFLEAFGKVQDNATKRGVPFRTNTVNENLTEGILGYMAEPGCNIDGLPYWLCAVSGRQSTKSTVTTDSVRAGSCMNGISLICPILPE